VLDYKQNGRLRDIHDAFVQYFSKLLLSNDDLRSIGDGLKNADEEGGNLKYSENNRKPDPTTTLFTTNPTCNDVSLCGERPKTNRLRRGTGLYEIVALYPNKWSLGP